MRQTHGSVSSFRPSVSQTPSSVLLPSQQQPRSVTNNSIGSHLLNNASQSAHVRHFAPAASGNLLRQQQQMHSNSIRPVRPPLTSGQQSGQPPLSARANQASGQSQVANAGAILPNAATVAKGDLVKMNHSKLIKLPFYDVHSVVMPVSSLMSTGNAKYQEVRCDFTLTCEQATAIASHRDMSKNPLPDDYPHQVLMRFCLVPLDTTEAKDEFPSSVAVSVNGHGVNLPVPIQSGRQGVEPKRPPKPISITNLVKLSPVTRNEITFRWSAEYGKCYVVGLWHVSKVNAAELLNRLKKRPELGTSVTKQMIVDKMKSDGDDLAMTSLRVSLACPIGKVRMQYPARSTVCAHLQCFDASLYLQMNERRPTWQCPVCDNKINFDDMRIDSYFVEVIKSDRLGKRNNDIVLNKDGSWKPLDAEGADDSDSDSSDDEYTANMGGQSTSASTKESDGDTTSRQSNVIECIELDDDDLPPLPPGRPPGDAAAV